MVNLINARIGEEINITLKEKNASGYRWKCFLPEDDGLKCIKDTCFTVESRIAGCSYDKTWTFIALRKGVYRLVFRHFRPWSDEITDTEMTEYEIDVE